MYITNTTINKGRVVVSMLDMWKGKERPHKYLAIKMPDDKQFKAYRATYVQGTLVPIEVDNENLAGRIVDTAIKHLCRKLGIEDGTTSETD